MTLYELDGRALVNVPTTSFARQGILERAHLQAALRDNISVLGDDLLVVAEEFGEFQDVRRRIDLLCVDKDGRLVVIELKRTDDGGHMDLQALRYAAMVSTMTFEQLADTYERHLRATEPAAVAEARTRLADFLDEVGGDEAVLERRVRIILVSAGFDQQITTTVLWLNDLYGLDITCVRLSPYEMDGRILLDVQQVIPLPEAQELMVRLRERESAVRAVTDRADGADWTRYVVTTPRYETPPLRKRRAILAMIQGLMEIGADPRSIQRAVPGPRFLAVEGEQHGEDLRGAFVEAYPKAQGNERRWFLEAPLHHEGTTWVLSKMWGTNTEQALTNLSALASGFSFRREDE